MTNREIYEWFEIKKFRHERSERSDKLMCYKHDLPKILRDFISEHPEYSKKLIDENTNSLPE